MPARVIISSCPADDKVLNRLITSLKASGSVDIDSCWSHQSVKAGERRALSFAQALNTAQIAVILVTQDYLTDDRIQIELPQLLALAEKGEIRLVPVPLRAVAWERQPFGIYHPIWPFDRPLAEMKSAEKDDCYVALSKCIIEALENAKPPTSKPPASAPRPDPSQSNSPTGAVEPAANPSAQTPPAALAPPRSSGPGAAPHQWIAIIGGITVTGSLFGAVVDVGQLITLTLALVISSGVSVAFALRYMGPWRDSLRRRPAWVPSLIGILVLIWGVFIYNQFKQATPKPEVTVGLTVLDREGRIVYDANVVSPLGTLKKENDRLVLTLDKPAPPFQVHASRGLAEQGEARITFDQPGTYTATIHLKAAPAVYTLRLSIIDEKGTPLDQAHIKTPVGELKRVGNIWEITIAAALKPSDPFLIHASAAEGRAGETRVSLTDKEVQVVEIQMSRDNNALLEGKVTGKENQPIKGASVRVEGYEAEAQTTDEHGRFSLKSHKYRDGWVRVIVKATGHAPIDQNVKVTDDRVTLVLKD